MNACIFTYLVFPSVEPSRFAQSSLLHFCNRVQQGLPPPKEGFVMGSRTQGVQEILKVWDVLTPTNLSWGMGHIEQGH